MKNALLYKESRSGRVDILWLSPNTYEEMTTVPSKFEIEKLQATRLLLPVVTAYMRLGWHNRLRFRAWVANRFLQMSSFLHQDWQKCLKIAVDLTEATIGQSTPNPDGKKAAAGALRASAAARSEWEDNPNPDASPVAIDAYGAASSATLIAGAASLAADVVEHDSFQNTMEFLEEALNAVEWEKSKEPEVKWAPYDAARLETQKARVAFVGRMLDCIEALNRLVPSHASAWDDEMKSLMEKSQNHVFISYLHEDQALVNRLVRSLMEAGVKVWLDRNDIRPGLRWRDAIRKAIRSGDYFLACFSSSYKDRDKSYMNHELALAVQELSQFATDRSWFIPVILSGGEIPDTPLADGGSLRDLQYVDLGADWEPGVHRILGVLLS